MFAAPRHASNTGKIALSYMAREMIEHTLMPKLYGYVICRKHSLFVLKNKSTTFNASEQD